MNTKIENQNGQCQATETETESSTRARTIYPPQLKSSYGVYEAEPWEREVNGDLLLADIAKLLKRFVVLPKWGAEALALWVVHTYAFQLREVTTYVGLESPEKRCGKTTLLTILSELVNRPVVASNISPSAFFRVIEEMQPTLLIDEADTFLQGNDELRGILNSGYKKKTAFVLRVSGEARGEKEERNPKLQHPTSREASNFKVQGEEKKGEVSLLTSSPTIESGNAGDEGNAVRLTSAATRSGLARYSCWCPKVVAAIGRLPETLADRCIVIRMHRKTLLEECERMRDLDTADIQRQCIRFVTDNAEAIANARPSIPESLNDRAADIWEPLFALADLAGGEWPDEARTAAVTLGSQAGESDPVSALLVDIAIAFVLMQSDRMFSRTMVEVLNARSAHRPWAERRNGRPITEWWLSQQLRPYGIRPRVIWIEGEQGRGYYRDDFRETFDRYIVKSEAKAYLEELRRPVEDNQKGEGKNVETGKALTTDEHG